MSGGATTTRARAWAITRSDGMMLGFTDHDRPLEFEGITFRPDAGLTARAVVQGLGLAVDNTEAQGVLSDDAITEADLMAGRWDGAEVRLWDVDWFAPADRRMIFRGHMGEVSRSQGAFRAELRGLAEPLNQPQGRVYQTRCAARLGDAACGFDMGTEGYSVEGVILSLSGDGAELELDVVGGYDAGWFAHGRMVVLDGAAAGLSAMVKLDRRLPGERRAVTLWAAPGAIPAVGDRVRLGAGCDKRGETCRVKFRNYLNFRGFPHLPPEDWMIAPQTHGGAA